MPALGDFLRIDAAPSFVTPWDRWVQDSLLAGRQACADRWQDCYFSAPIWRFTLSPGLAGPSGILGVVMPSVDRVGRQFPLTLFTAIGGDAVAAHRSGTAVFAALEEIALDALSDDASRDSLAEALHRVTPPPDPLTPTHRPTRRSQWSALIAEGERAIGFDGMPSPSDSVGFYDLSASVWQGAQTQDQTA